MEGSATLSFWQLFLLALAPAVVAALVAVLAPLVSGYWQEQAEQRKRRAEKYEALIAALFQHKHWLERAINAHIFREYEVDATPMATVFAIANAHFPEFTDDIQALDLASDRCESALLDAGMVRLKEGKFSPEALTPSRNEYVKLYLKLQSRLREYARKEFK